MATNHKPKMIEGYFDDEYISGTKGKVMKDYQSNNTLMKLDHIYNDMIDNLRASSEWKNQLTMKKKFLCRQTREAKNF